MLFEVLLHFGLLYREGFVIPVEPGAVAHGEIG